MAGEATYREDLPLVMNRKGHDEQTWFTFSYSPVRDDSGEVAGMFCAVSETTQRVMAETALRASEGRLRELNETLERRVAESLAERRLLAEIVEASRASFRSRMSITDGSLSTPPRRTRAMLDATLGGHVAIDTRLGAGIWSVEGDPGEMELAIINLCVNARDAMPGGGFITIAADNVRIEGKALASSCRYRCRDTGIGMAPEVQARVFEPFFTTKEIHKGSGLGLPQVYGFAQQCLGRVTIQSAVGVGTTVTLLLPRSRKASAGEEASGNLDRLANGGGHADRRKHVLLVEDDHEVAALTRELLTSFGCSVSHVASPDAALPILQSEEIDIVVTDLMMPGLVNGLQLAREIRTRQPALPILMTTGSASTPAGMEKNEFPLLLKPYSADSLAQALERAFAAGGSRWQ